MTNDNGTNRPAAAVFRIGVLGAFVSMALLSCGSEGDGRDRDGPGSSGAVANNEATMRVFVGLVVFGHEVRSFRPCGSEDALWAVDRTSRLQGLCEEMAPHGEPYQEVFAAVEGRTTPAPGEGFGADYSGGIEIVDVLYMAREGFGCEIDLSGFEYRVYGNEPFWTAQVSNREIRLTILGEPERKFVEIERREKDNQILFAGRNEAGAIMELAIVREPCRDSMSGTLFGASATLSLESKRLHGCALKGTGSTKNQTDLEP